ncbi:hypothetical protein QCE62_05610 [Caballeronia sp. LZ033]|uniref:hypothetical protein n=1 Tax=Caballeronia sp. LZ033 TaxID=3038566 RepID=UPI00285919F9|nr:hypothetical protein [Caballeronia sp. LZ033]MDR5813066.1 hypothetical protein [Caballeronia sp. LZ033]
MTDPFVDALDAADNDEADFRQAVDDLVQLAETEAAFALTRGVDPGDIAASM